MPTLIRRSRDAAAGLAREFFVAEDSFATVGEADSIPPDGPGALGVILPVSRLDEAMEPLRLEARQVGALVGVDDDLALLIPHLPRLAVVALRFDKYRDGRSYSTAVLLRTRHRFDGEVRAVGDVLVEEATQMIRCGFDAFAVADESASQDWMAKARLHRHGYLTAPDGRTPAYAERAAEV